MKNLLKKLFPPTHEEVSKTYSEPSSQQQRRDALDREKEEHTKRKEPWVAVIDTQINEENIRNGFFELDWNNEFIEQLLDAGYTGDTSEAIVDQWFKTVVAQILMEDGMDTDRGMGHINIIRNSDGTSEVS